MTLRVRICVTKETMSNTEASEKRRFEFLSLSLLLGLAAAIGTLIFFGWLTDEVLEGDSRQFDEATRAAVHQLASPALTTIMRGLFFCRIHARTGRVDDLVHRAACDEES